MNYRILELEKKIAFTQYRIKKFQEITYPAKYKDLFTQCYRYLLSQLDFLLDYKQHKDQKLY